MNSLSNTALLNYQRQSDAHAIGRFIEIHLVRPGRRSPGNAGSLCPSIRFTRAIVRTTPARRKHLFMRPDAPRINAKQFFATQNPQCDPVLQSPGKECSGSMIIGQRISSSVWPVFRASSSQDHDGRGFSPRVHRSWSRVFSSTRQSAFARTAPRKASFTNFDHRESRQVRRKSFSQSTCIATSCRVTSLSSSICGDVRQCSGK